MSLKYRIIHGDCLSVMEIDGRYDCIFADPPDNIGLAYDEYEDNVPEGVYSGFLMRCLCKFAEHAPIVWFSFNSKYTLQFGSTAYAFLKSRPEWECKPCVQTFTFGQYRDTDFANNHRPLWRFSHKSASFYPEHVKVPSWREQNGDKRAKLGGRVPGDVFDFARVTGNSKQRRRWHPTQLNEGLVELAIKFSTRAEDNVLDPFGGTGTTMRVAKSLARSCTLIEKSAGYCQKLREEHSDAEYITYEQ